MRGLFTIATLSRMPRSTLVAASWSSITISASERPKNACGSGSISNLANGSSSHGSKSSNVYDVPPSTNLCSTGVSVSILRRMYASVIVTGFISSASASSALLELLYPVRAKSSSSSPLTPLSKLSRSITCSGSNPIAKTSPIRISVLCATIYASDKDLAVSLTKNSSGGTDSTHSSPRVDCRLSFTA